MGEGELLSFAFWHGGRLVGFAPMYVFRSPRQPPVPQKARDKDGHISPIEPARKLFLLGTGNSDYLDVLFDPAFRLQCWRALLTEIRNVRACWDVCSFQDSVPDRRFWRRLSTCPSCAWREPASALRGD